MGIFAIGVFVFVIAILLLVVVGLGTLAWWMWRDDKAKLMASCLATVSVVLGCCAAGLAYSAVVKSEWCWSGRWESTTVPISAHESIRQRPGCVVPR